jgi:hypothetical protein
VLRHASDHAVCAALTIAVGTRSLRCPASATATGVPHRAFVAAGVARPLDGESSHELAGGVRGPGCREAAAGETCWPPRSRGCFHQVAATTAPSLLHQTKQARPAGESTLPQLGRPIRKWLDSSAGTFPPARSLATRLQAPRPSQVLEFCTKPGSCLGHSDAYAIGRAGVRAPKDVTDRGGAPATRAR